MPLLENCCLHHSACFISVWLHMKEEFHALPGRWKSQVRENLESWLPVHQGMINAARIMQHAGLQLPHCTSRQWPIFILSHWSEVSVSPDICKCFYFGMSGLQCLGLRSISINFSMWWLLQGKYRLTKIFCLGPAWFKSSPKSNRTIFHNYRLSGMSVILDCVLPGEKNIV